MDSACIRENVDRDTVDRILGPGLIQSTILKYLSNVFCLKEVQACVSLHALRFLSCEDLKVHLARHVKKAPTPHGSNDFFLNHEIYRMKTEKDHADTNTSLLLNRGSRSKILEESRRGYRCMEYVPLEVYEVVRAGLNARRQMRALSENIDGDDNISKVFKSSAPNHRVNALDGACKAGFDVEDIKRILGLLADNSSFYWTLGLYSASKYGHIHIVRYFCETLGIRDNFEHSAFMIACEHGHIDIVKYLYETIKHMDPSEVDHKDRTAFMIACEHGHIDIVKYLHETIGNLDMNAKDHEDRTAFTLACWNGHIDIVKYLYETIGNLDANARDREGRTAFTLACWNGHVDISRYLYAKTGSVDVDDKDCEGKTAFMLACKNGRIESVKYLYEAIRKVNVNLKDDEDWTPFMFACWNGHIDIVKYLHETIGNVDVNARDHENRTAFTLACWNGHIDIVKYLYETIGNVDVNTRDREGWTAFTLACWFGHTQVSEYLLCTAEVDVKKPEPTSTIGNLMC